MSTPFRVLRPAGPRLHRGLVAAAALAGSVLLGACAHKGEAPVEQLASARSSITQAESAGAAQSAPVELLASREKLGRAEAAVRDEHFADARALAEEAQADAELAERRARVASAQAAAAELARGKQQLRDEAQRSARP